MLIPLAQNMPSAAYSIGSAVIAFHDSIGYGLAFAFITGALLYNIGFYKTKLIPRWLSVWGIIALVTHLVAVTMSVFGADSLSPLSMVLKRTDSRAGNGARRLSYNLRFQARSIANIIHEIMGKHYILSLLFRIFSFNKKNDIIKTD